MLMSRAAPSVCVGALRKVLRALIPVGLGTSVRNWRNPDGQQTFNVSSPLFWHSSSQTLYNLSQFSSAGSCRQQGPVSYKWGFSFLLLYVFVIGEKSHFTT
ncbi:hypothetical protein GJ744_010750 [Endocarpon pusillum]|uniref:Uncharacterized protein n=1 Tax=Endocarpon pusillum TaxID=364733 RepID=A0A8H7AHP6_9EURO|nr:hypothetical protein GJ744_010750 [Endocarpon pusillum]